MFRLVFVILLLILPRFAEAVECPVSKPNMVDPIGALKSNDYHGWFGSSELAALIPHSGRWMGMGEDYNFRNKFWWWRSGYRAGSNLEKSLTIYAKNLDNGDSFSIDRATNARAGSDNYEWDSMLVGMEYSSRGCWEIIGSFGKQKLVIVLEVGE